MRRGRNRGPLLLGLVALLILLIPASASADRHPTPRERKGIERAAHRGYGEPGVKIKVSDIRVSTTKRSWATAVVTVDYGAGTQDYQSQFHRQGGGSWDGGGQKMPAAVEDDLGLSEPGESKVVRVGTYVVLGLIGLFILSKLSKLGGDSSSGADSSRPAPSRFDPTPNPAGNKPCSVCGGSGTFSCTRCGGQKTVQSPNPPPGANHLRGLFRERCNILRELSWHR